MKTPLDLIPTGWRWFLFSLLAAALVGFGFVKGQANIQAKWDKENARIAIKAEQARADKAEATTEIITRYVYRTRDQAITDQSIIQEIPNHVQADTPALPAGFRMLHDAAATGTAITSPSTADAATVPAQDLAITIAENYAACRTHADQLSALQLWVLTTKRIDEAAR